MKHLNQFIFKAGVALALFLAASAAQAEWSLKYAPIMTDWAQLVDPTLPRPEYPRPQMVRSQWLNLNGLWQFQAGSETDPVPRNQTLSSEILVPFPMESALSGVMEYHARSWYRRSFQVPTDWSGQRILLHFGAVDWESEVFVNGTSLGIHKGGYDAFYYDVTAYLNGTGPQELIVRVYDPTDALGVPRGKQTLYPGGIMYTSNSGIWQTVWLEPVPATSIASFKLTPNIDTQQLGVKVDVNGAASGLTVWATARNGNIVVGKASGAPGSQISVPVPNSNLWSPTNPFLYSLDLVLSNSTTRIDAVESYFGMRKISMGTNNGVVKMLLNNQFVFQFGPLDQGFWPDGIYSAPTDDAMKSDIEQAKILGYNMIRKHIKVEPARWYYWADKLGMLVWQDMPSANSYTGNPQPLDVPQFETELTNMVQKHWNSPSIVSWVVFNESQGQHRTEEYVQIVRALDPTRLINQASGGSYYGVGDILDWHSYPNPSAPSSATQAVVCGEFGGVGLPVTNHTWASGWGYVAATNGTHLTSMFADFCAQLQGFVQNDGLSAAVYTEITDVEIELNGFLTYDRKARKLNPADTRQLMAGVTANYQVTTILPTSRPNAQTWKYRTTTPSSSWTSTNYTESASWISANGGFGAGNPPNTSGLVRTTWNTSDIWLRRTFNPGNLTAQQIANLYFSVYHDEDVEIYINGVLAATASGYTTTYSLLPMNSAGRAALIPNASNLIAVHCHQTGGGQYIDAGIVVRQMDPVVIPVLPAPQTPSRLTIAAGKLGVSMGWSSIVNADTYRIQRATSPSGPFTDVGVAAVNAFTDVTAEAGKSYSYVVSAVNPTGQSAPSQAISISLPPAPPAVLRAWFRADAIAGVADGGALASWQDISGNNFSATQAAANQRPVYVRNAVNGRPAVRFNAARTNYLAFNRPVEDDFTILCVYRSTQGYGTGTQFYQGAGLINGEVSSVVNDFGICLNAEGRLAAGTGNPDRSIASATGFNNGLAHLVTFRRERAFGSLSLFVDGQLQGTATGGTQSLTSPTRLVIGAQQTLINYLDGDIAEIKIFATALTEADRIAEENALLCRYGIAGGAGPAAPENFSAITGNTDVQLAWSMTTGADSYLVQWATAAAGPYNTIASGLTAGAFTHVNPLNGATNYYRVTGVNACGQGTPATASAVLPLPQLAVGFTGGNLQLSWPQWAGGWQLWSATNLAGPVIWTLETTAATTNGNVSVILPQADGSKFFRLFKP